MPGIAYVDTQILGILGAVEFLLFAVLGLVLGSFSSALIHRIPEGQSVFAARARSACPHCDHTLGPLDLIPLFSWLLARGHCRYCDANIPLLYPVLELTAAIMAIAILMFYPAESLLQSLIALATLPFLLALLIIDIRHKILPNILVAIVFGLGLVNTGYALYLHPEGFEDIALAHLGGALVYAALAWGLAMIMAKILKKQALGMGDVKFFAVAGVWLGLGSLGAFCILSGFLGILFGAAWQKLKGEVLFPFGPALIVSFFILLLMNGSHWF
ncbi:MAG: prepilin peptidase [Rhodospirillales bacterium]|nr:prepilin peptidase [Rhodospirillales bacterium]